MFKDARSLDRQRTATSFDRQMTAYTRAAESWFDGSVGSVDRRLAQCERLLHQTRFHTARMGINDSARYLRAADMLNSDREVLAGLRDDLLTGGANRQNVVGPPGWRMAVGPVTGPANTAGQDAVGSGASSTGAGTGSSSSGGTSSTPTMPSTQPKPFDPSDKLPSSDYNTGQGIPNGINPPGGLGTPGYRPPGLNPSNGGGDGTGNNSQFQDGPSNSSGGGSGGYHTPFGDIGGGNLSDTINQWLHGGGGNPVAPKGGFGQSTPGGGSGGGNKGINIPGLGSFPNIFGSQHEAGNPHRPGSEQWFDWEDDLQAGKRPEGSGPHAGVPEDIFPEGGVPLHGPLNPEQEAWLNGR